MTRNQKQIGGRRRGALRHPFFVSCLSCVSWFILFSGTAAAADYERDVLPVVAKYCHSCHGDQPKPKGGLSLTKFKTAADARTAKAVWQTAAESVRAREMPPEGKPQPTDAERAAVEDWVAALLAETDLGGRPDPGRPVLRRLTRLEYNNSVRDLLGLDTDLFPFPERLPFKSDHFDPSATAMPGVVRMLPYEFGQKMPALLTRAGVPGDNRAEHGFANRGDALNLSPLLFEKYLAVADEITGHTKATATSPVLKELFADPSGTAVRPKLAVLMGRAFRRPVDEAKVETYLRPYDAAKAKVATDSAALRESLAAVLASPEFLFLAEPVDPTQPAVRSLDGYELAARLSYFLWASTPDAELAALASSGRLTDPAVLEAQARRMLRDPKAKELAESFAVQWLRLNELWAAQPDPQQFKTFYAGPQGKGTLHADLMGEALLLFETVLIEDRSILDFVDADYAYLSRRLLRFYGLADRYAAEMEAAGMSVPPGLKGPALFKATAAADSAWLRVRWPDRTRGGFLTCGAVLTLTSLPARTSPVKRGAWVLESVYNRPPSPPAVAVEPLDDQPAGPAAKTVRAKLEAHRADPTCAGCHARIDPPGFALEAFDAVGAWRTSDGGQPIDAAGALPDGRAFDDPAAFKDAVLAKKDEFVRGFVEHLLGYALGRKLEYYDQPEVKRIADAVAADGYRLSRAVVSVATSYPFRYVRNQRE